MSAFASFQCKENKKDRKIKGYMLAGFMTVVCICFPLYLFITSILPLKACCPKVQRRGGRGGEGARGGGGRGDTKVISFR